MSASDRYSAFSSADQLFLLGEDLVAVRSCIADDHFCLLADHLVGDQECWSRCRGNALEEILARHVRAA